MIRLSDYPLLIFVATFLSLWLSVWTGARYLRRLRKQSEDVLEDFGVVLSATLTLLGLVIGFSFSMAISRYDQRKNLEEEEANAIGTEYVRADLLPSADAVRVRALLKDYLEQRILYYSTRDREQIRRINAATAKVQAELWSAIVPVAEAQPTAIVALAVAGMNDVLNSQGYSQAAEWNRIPRPAWLLMIAIAVCCNLLIGYGARSVSAERGLRLVLPLVAAVSFFLIADIDSPRGGVIRVPPQNLMSLAESLRTQ